MSRSVNKVILIGTLGRDPEVRSTANGTNVAKFSLATNDRYKDRSGEWQEKTEWHNVVAWGRLADVARDYLSKGERVYVEGKLQTSSWDDKQTGEKKYRTEIVAVDLVLIGVKRDSHEPEQHASEPAPINDNDVPF